MFPMIIVLCLVYLTINSILIQVSLDAKSKGKKYDMYDQGTILFLFVFFGMFMYPFTKQLKKIRKKMYLRKRHKDLTHSLTMRVYLDPTGAKEELFNIDRLLKLEKIIRKS